MDLSQVSQNRALNVDHWKSEKISEIFPTAKFPHLTSTGVWFSG